MTKDLAIIGAGDFGREVAALVGRINEVKSTWNLLGFIDDNINSVNTMIDGHEVIGDTEYLLNYQNEIYCVCSVGDSQTRRSVIARITEPKDKNIKFATLVDPSAIIMKNTSIQEGSIICAGTILTINCQVGRHSILNLNCTVGHDTVLGDFFTAHPGTNISGKVVFRDECYCGTGCKIIQGITITNKTILGAGAVVVKDITESGTYVGVPAKKY